MDPKTLALLIISSLDGALMISRLERRKEALLAIRSHHESYLDTGIRVEDGI